MKVMKLAVMAVFVSVLFMILFMVGGAAAFFEPSELLQWNQKERLTGSFSARYYFINDQPVQMGKFTVGGPNYLSRQDVRLQYRFWEGNIGKVEGFVGTSLLTHWDVADRLHFTAELGYTFKDRIRLSLGHFGGLNVGIENYPARGITAQWLGVSGMIYKMDNISVVGYGRYYWYSKIPSQIGNRFGTGDDGNIASDILKTEFGFQGLFKQGKWEFDIAPYVYLNDSYKTDRIGTWASARYDMRSLLKNKLPLKVEVGGNYNANTDFKKDEKQLWLRLILEFK